MSLSVDNKSGRLFKSFSFILIIASSHNSWVGNSKVSARTIGIVPMAKHSHKRILFGPEPEGHKLNSESNNNWLYSFVLLIWCCVSFNSLSLFCLLVYTILL